MTRLFGETPFPVVIPACERVFARHQRDLPLVALQHRANRAFAEWLERQEEQNTVYLSVITVHEIEKGIRLLEAKGATAKAALIRGILDGLVAGYADHILAVDIESARAGGRMEAEAVASGYNSGAVDAIIAGTAEVHGLTIVTKNRRHFEPFGLAVLSPDDLTL